MGPGRAARLPRRLHVRPPVLAQLSRPAVARRRADPRRSRCGHRAGPAGHAGHLPELPPPGPARPRDLVTLDDVSGGRITLGIGSGGTGFDATALGHRPWPARERADRFEEFVELLDLLLTTPAGASREGRHYSAHEVRNLPGCVQQPRIPFAVAAIGPRAMRLAARRGQAWVTFGDPTLPDDAPPDQQREALRRQHERLDEACAAEGRDVDERILLVDTIQELRSVDAFVDFAGTFETIAVEAPGQLR